MPQITVHVVFDTNSIKSESAERLVSLPASKLTDKFSSSTSPKVRWHLPPMVKSEREYRMIDEATKLLSDARKVARLMERPEVTEDEVRAQVRKIIEKQIKDHGIEEINFDENLVNWRSLINRAVQRQPPFDPNSESEKGFRDAIILETLLQLHDKLGLSSPNKLILLSGDGLLKKAVEQALANKPEVMLLDTIGALETYLVALSKDIDEQEAEKVVLIAQRFLLESLPVGKLSELLFDRFPMELKRGPPAGGIADRWRVVPGETALVGKQNSRWSFETAVIVEVAASRTIPNIPTVTEERYTGGPPMHGLYAEQRPFVTGLSGGTTVNLYTSDPVGVALHSTDPVGVANRPVMSISSIMPSLSNSFVYSVSDRIVRNIGRHIISLSWSATLSEKKQLSDFEIMDVKYQGVVWE